MKFRRKAAKKDYAFSLLPHSRKAAFSDIIRNRFGIVFKTGLILFVFAIPFFLVFALKYYLFLPTALEVLTTEEYINFKITNGMIFDLVYLVAFAIFAVGLAGISNIYKKVCWQEGIFFWHDFKTGIKENSLQFVVVSIVFSIIRFAAITVSRFDFHILIRYSPLAVYYVFSPVLMMALSIGTSYKTKIFASLRDGFAFCLKKPLPPLCFALFILILRILHFAIAEVVPGYIFLLNTFDVILIVVLIPIFIIGWLNYSLYLFDELTNKKYYPEAYHRGLIDSSLYKGYKIKK